MELIFNWSKTLNCASDEWVESEKIISLQISQKEFGFATARVVFVSNKILFDVQYAKIGVKTKNGDVDLLFVGRVIAFPSGVSSTCIEIELISEPIDYLNQLETFRNNRLLQDSADDKHSTANAKNDFDKLYFSNNDLANPSIFLEGGTDVFYWDMRESKLSLSDLNKGEKFLEVSSGEMLKNSLKIKLSREPYKSVNVSLSASWIQHVDGMIDLMPVISQHFKYGKINSLSNIKNAITKLTEFPLSSGYRLLYKNIKEVVPSEFADRYPLVSPGFLIKDSVSPLKFKRFYFEGKMICGWNYKQKRTETVEFKIVNSNREFGREKALFMKLNAIQISKKYPTWCAFTYYGVSQRIVISGQVFECIEAHISDAKINYDYWNFIEEVPDSLKDDTSSSFFNTNRGKNAIRYAMRKAFALIAYSSRYVEIEFCVNAEKYIYDARLTNSVKIIDSRFENGFIEGKIIKVKFVADSSHRLLKITIACGTSLNSKAIFDKIQTVGLDIPSDDAKVNPADVINGVEIINSAEEQISILQKSGLKTASELKNLIKKNPTKIKVYFHPQNRIREIKRHIRLPDFFL